MMKKNDKNNGTNMKRKSKKIVTRKRLILEIFVLQRCYHKLFNQNMYTARVFKVLST